MNVEDPRMHPVLMGSSSIRKVQGSINITYKV